MKKGYIKCPFCANEIKKWAIRCQFCNELLDHDKCEITNIFFWKHKRYLIIIVCILFALLIIFTGIKYLWSESQNDIFEKNLKCQEYLDSFTKENTPKLSWVIRNVWVFYSPREKSCIWYFNYYDSWESDGDYWYSRIYDSYVIYWLLWNTKRSSYTKDYRPAIPELTCEKESDFNWKKWTYKCNIIDNDKWEELRKKELERLKWN